MTQIGQIACPHCGAINPATGAFCESCGKALPTAVATGPRIVSNAAGFAGTHAGRSLQSEDLHKQSKKAAGALLVVAVIFAVFGPIQVFLPGQIPPELRTAAMVEVFGIAFVFLVLYLWARKQPLPAAIVGLILFATLQVVYIILDPTNLVKGILLKIIVITILVKAIQAGVKYRQLQRETAGVF